MVQCLSLIRPALRHIQWRPRAHRVVHHAKHVTHAAPKVSAKAVCTKAAAAFLAGGLTMLPGASTLSGFPGGGVGGFPAGVVSEYGGSGNGAGSGGSGFAGGGGGSFGSGGAAGFGSGLTGADTSSFVQALAGSSSSSLMPEGPSSGSPQVINLNRVDHFPQRGDTQPESVVGRPSFSTPTVAVPEPSSLLMLPLLLAFSAFARWRAR